MNIKEAVDSVIEPAFNSERITGSKLQKSICDLTIFYNLPIGEYTLNITLYNVQNYSSATKIIPFSIRERNTEILYEPVGNIPWNLNTSLILTWHDTDVVSNYLIINRNRLLINNTQNFGAISYIGNNKYFFRFKAS